MKLRAPNYAEVASTLALTLALSTGGAYAAGLITSGDIAKNAVTTKHIKNGTVKERDLNTAVKAKLNTSGAAGLVGPAGATGATGATGGTGPRGFSAWDTIPSGVTVFGQEFANLRGTAGVINVNLPAAAPTPLFDEAINFAGNSSVTTDDDATCTGTYGNPTAPAGKVCLYNFALGSTGTATVAEGTSWTGSTLGTRAFYADYSGAPSNVGEVFFTWAYTAP